MKIKLSRHAKRRAKLYKISETTLLEILKNITLPEGKHDIIRDVKGYRFPLKIVVDIENEIMTVITNYPLKKGRKKWMYTMIKKQMQSISS